MLVIWHACFLPYLARTPYPLLPSLQPVFSQPTLFRAPLRFRRQTILPPHLPLVLPPSFFQVLLPIDRWALSPIHLPRSNPFRMTVAINALRSVIDIYRKNFLSIQIGALLFSVHLIISIGHIPWHRVEDEELLNSGIELVDLGLNEMDPLLLCK